MANQLIRKEVLLEDWHIQALKEMGEPISPLIRRLVDEFLSNRKSNYIKEIAETEKKLLSMKKSYEEDINMFLEDFKTTIKQANTPNSGVIINQSDYLNKMSSIYASKKGITIAIAKEELGNLVKEIKGTLHICTMLICTSPQNNHL